MQTLNNINTKICYCPFFKLLSDQGDITDNPPEPAGLLNFIFKQDSNYNRSLDVKL